MAVISVRNWFAAAILAVMGTGPATAQEPPPPPPELSEQAIDQADFEGWRGRVDAQARRDEAEAMAADAGTGRKGRREPRPARPKDQPASYVPDPFLVRVQILLDRAHASPGVIDGRDGENLRKAIRAFRELKRLPPGDAPDPDFWAQLSADGAKPTKLYTITEEDVGGRFLNPVPKDFAKLAKLKWIGFRDTAEMLAERFHMDERLIRKLNPGAEFGKAGQTLLVAETGTAPTQKVSRIEVDRAGGELRAFAEDGSLVLIFPATVGSSDTPSPTGKMKVNGSFPNPHYIYDPKKNFQQGRNKRKLTLPPGPNGPVGSMWIDLTKPTYGIHGTPDPEKIDKTGSHGCVRLTNWDAETLGGLVEKGKTTVEFR
jgi:lipoprotein-anchoring transpeptidase ErfK/SrfK